MNRLIEGDCLDAMAEIPDFSVALVLCDLPYGTTQNRWDSAVPLDRLWEQYRRVLRPDGAVVLTGQGPFTARLVLSNEAWFRYKLVWVKSKPTNFLNAKKQPLRRHEDVCVFYREQPTYHPQRTPGEAYDKGVRKDQLTGSYGDFRPVRVASEGGRYPTDVVYFKTAESEGPVWHPTQKPVALGRWIVRTYTDPGDLVLDNAFGSGSFLVAALAEGRSFVGIERNREVHAFKKEAIDFLAIARRRLWACWEGLDEETRGKVRREGIFRDPSPGLRPPSPPAGERGVGTTVTLAGERGVGTTDTPAGEGGVGITRACPPRPAERGEGLGVRGVLPTPPRSEGGEQDP